MRYMHANGCVMHNLIHNLYFVLKAASSCALSIRPPIPFLCPTCTASLAHDQSRDVIVLIRETFKFKVSWCPRGVVILFIYLFF